MPPLTRRTLLRLTAGIAGACALDPVWQMGLATGSAAPPPEQPVPGEAQSTSLRGSFISAARGGIETEWLIARPPGQTGRLRPVIALHGRGSKASGGMGLGGEGGAGPVC